MSVIQALNEIGQQAVEGIQANMQRLGLNNTGKTSASLRYDITFELGKTVLVVSGEGQLFSLEFGAGPIKRRTDGKFIESIAEWGKSKLGLNDKEAKSLAFAYLKARTGKAQGRFQTVAPDGSYKVPNPYNKGGVVSSTVNDSFIQKANREILENTIGELVESVGKTLR